MALVCKLHSQSRVMPKQGFVPLQMLADRLAAAGVLHAADSGYGRKSAAAAPRNLRKAGPPRRADSDEDSDFD